MVKRTWNVIIVKKKQIKKIFLSKNKNKDKKEK